MHFTKMHGLGNDYLYHYGELENAPELSRRLSDRHFGIGSDGIITISPSETTDCKMRIFNADGSEAMMCGNGIRCVGKYMYDKGYLKSDRLTVETLSGIKHLALHIRNGKVEEAVVNMGKCAVEKPVSLDTVYGAVTVTPVSMGNPHAVIFVDHIGDAPLTTVGKELEHHAYFAGGVNVEFVEVYSRNAVRMRVWERGSGITLACGTGACATVAACIKAGLCSKNSDVAVTLDGGTLMIRVLDDDTVMMTGPAATVCECEVEES